MRHKAESDAPTLSSRVGASRAATNRAFGPFGCRCGEPAGGAELSATEGTVKTIRLQLISCQCVTPVGLRSLPKRNLTRILNVPSIPRILKIHVRQSTTHTAAECVKPIQRIAGQCTYKVHLPKDKRNARERKKGAGVLSAVTRQLVELWHSPYSWLWP